MDGSEGTAVGVGVEGAAGAVPKTGSEIVKITIPDASVKLATEADKNLDTDPKIGIKTVAGADILGDRDTNSTINDSSGGKDDMSVRDEKIFKEHKTQPEGTTATTDGSTADKIGDNPNAATGQPNAPERKPGETDEQYEARGQEFRNEVKRDLEKRVADGTATENDKARLKGINEQNKNTQEVKPPPGAENPQTKSEETTSVENDKRFQDLESKLNNLTAENIELKNEIRQMKTAMKEILPMIATLSKNLQEKETDPKEKKTLAQMLLEIAKILAYTAFSEFLQESNKTITQPNQ
jgi:hypothetical protein